MPPALPRRDRRSSSRNCASSTRSSRVYLLVIAVLALVGYSVLWRGYYTLHSSQERTLAAEALQHTPLEQQRDPTTDHVSEDEDEEVSLPPRLAISTPPPTTSEPHDQALRAEATPVDLASASLQTEAIGPTTAVPTPLTRVPRRVHGQSELCYNERDFGLIDALAQSARVFCAEPSEKTDARSNSNASSDDSLRRTRTRVTLMDPLRGGTRALVFAQLAMDLRQATVKSPIASLAEDGGGHDPRFAFASQLVDCDCDELVTFASQLPSKKKVARRGPTPEPTQLEAPLRIWNPTFADPPSQDSAETLCGRSSLKEAVDLRTGTGEEPDVVEVAGKVVLLARRDDHNPFFQISSALNAWLAMKALDWTPSDVRVVHFDGGYPSPIDELHSKLLAPTLGLTRAGDEWLGKRVRFTGEVLLAPFEGTGPLMQHLNDKEPCYESKMIQAFRNASLEAIQAQSMEEEGTQDHVPSGDLVVTVISRRPYSGRKIARRWLNEEEIIAKMRTEYADEWVQGRHRAVVFQCVDTVAMPLREQMRLILESDVVISMHGAGMVNVLWARPETLVIEIFPKRRRRWGFRNLCQFVGCDWHEFRGGTDIPTSKDLRDENAFDKVIEYDAWHKFFDPIFRVKMAETFEQQDKADRNNAIGIDTAPVVAGRPGTDNEMEMGREEEPAR